MRHPDLDLLAALTIDPDEVPADVHDHVAGCVECRETLAELGAVVAGVRSAADEPALVAPPPGLRDRVLAAAFATPQDHAEHIDHTGATEATHDPAGAGAPVVSLESARERRRSIPWWLTTLAASAALVAGIGVGRLTVGEESPQERLVAATDLSEVDGPAERGAARVVSRDDADAMILRIDAQDLGGGPGIREVWLLNVDGERMVSLGLLTSGEEAEFSVPAELLDEGYRIVDISVEPDDGDPRHSGNSLARGELA